MTGGDQPPFRKPCVGSASANACRRAASQDGARYGHCNPADDGIAKYILSTTVPNPDGGTIAPYEVYNSAGSTFPCQEPPAPPPARNNTPSSGWIGGGAYQFTLVSGQVNTAPESWTNSGTANFSVAHKTGSKSVAACLQWNGWWGFDNPEGVPTVQCWGAASYHPYECLEWVQGSLNNYEPKRLTPPSQTKYLNLDVQCHYTATVPLPNTWDFRDYDLTDYRTFHVDKNSGEIVLDSGADFTPPTNPPVPLVSLLKVPAGLADGINFVGFTQVIDLRSYTVACSTTDEDGNPTGAAEGTTHVNGKMTRNSDGLIVEYWEANFGTGDFKRKTGHGPNGINTFSGTLAITTTWETLSISETVYSYEKQVWSNNDYLDYSTDATLIATLLNERTKDDMNADRDLLLSKFPLNDDKLYPWRMDGLPQVAPLLTRNQVEANIAPTALPPLLMTDENGVDPGGGGYVSTPWKDPNVWQYQGTSYPKTLVKIHDGEILGIPKPAGYEDAFCYQFKDWQGGSDPTAIPEVFDWCIFGWGMTVAGYNTQTGAQLPLNATQWTSNYECINKPPGAYLGYNDPTDPSGPASGLSCHSGTYSGGARRAGALWGVKYAEIIDTWPSQSFARPGGDDLFIVDETKVFLATNVSGSGAGSVWALTTPSGGAVSSFDTSGNWGGPVVGGWYSGCTFAVVSGVGHVILGTKAFNVPTGWQSKSYIAGVAGTIDDTDVMFGQLRFPACPSLLGRAAITMVGTTATFGAAQPAFGMAAAGTETVDIYDAAMTLLSGGSGVTATRVDDTHFTLAVNYPGAAFVMIHGTSAKWYMNDDTPKGNYAVLEYLFDMRTGSDTWGGEFGRLAGVTDCAGNNPPTDSPSKNKGFASFSQTPGCLPTTTACGPRVVCISPNGETWENGITIPFPTDFVLDERYGSKWQADIYATMSDLFYQPPHAPCIGYAIQWFEDDGTCIEPVPGGVHDWDAAHYPHDIPVECELTLPANYGPAQNESAPALPSGIVIGWLSPVTNAPGPGVAAPKDIPTFDCTGLPLPTLTEFILHSRFCSLPGGCIFAVNYAPGANGC